jgi:hypothetical protein
MVRLALLAALVAPLGTLAQGKLDAVRDEVNGSRSDDSSKSDCSTSDDSSASGAFAASLDQQSGRPRWDSSADPVLLAILAPWSVPHVLLDPGMETDGRFARYPFAEPGTGLMVLDRPDADRNRRGFTGRDDLAGSSVRAAVEVGSDFDGLTRLGVRLFVDTDSRFGLKSDWDWYHERLPCGCRDDLGIADVTATYRFVQHEHVQMHAGLGVRWLIDRGKDPAGVNVLYGLDVFPVEPVHLFASAEAGTLGDAGLWRLRGGAGVTWGHAEVYAGYDYLRIGSVGLFGPFVGLRLWF